MISGQGRLPNFLIIGAPKSGTTSLGRYLRHHPDVFMPATEEPKYFVYGGVPPHYESPDNGDLLERARWRFDDYLALFADWKHQRAGGERSATYLWSHTAPGAIRATIPDARLVAILRNPADRAFSHFAHNLRSLREPLTDFRAALDAEPERRKQNWSYNYLYRDRGRYAEQLERYFALFPSEQLLVVLYDDLVADAGEVMRKICRHLGVSDEHGLDVAERHNISEGVPTSGRMHRLLTQEGFLKSALRAAIPGPLQKHIWRAVYLRNLKPLPKLDPRLRSELVEEFTDEIRALAKLIDRDLSGWLVR